MKPQEFLISNDQKNPSIVVKDMHTMCQSEFTIPQRKDYFRILLFKKGDEGSLLVDLKEYKVADNTIFIINPGQIFSFKENKSSSCLYIQFTKEFLGLSILPAKMYWFLKLYTYSKICLSQLQFNTLYSYFNQIKNMCNYESELQHKKLQKLFGLVFFELLEYISEKSILISKEDISYKFMSLVIENICEFRLVKNYANLLNISVNNLEKHIKSSYGKCPLTIINELLVIEIKRLLLIGELTHKEIAFMFNFDSQSSYSRFIKLQTGVTPTALKKRLKSKHYY